MSHQAMKRCRGTLNAYDKVKEANLKSLHTVGFQLYDILEKVNYGDSKKVRGCQGWVFVGEEG